LPQEWVFLVFTARQTDSEGSMPFKGTQNHVGKCQRTSHLFSATTALHKVQVEVVCAWRYL